MSARPKPVKSLAFGSARMRKVDEAVIPLFNQLSRENPGTLSLGQGIVFYPPPPEAISYAAQRMTENSCHGYGSVIGLTELREAIAEKLQRKNGISVSSSQCVVVTAGSNMAFHALVLAICDPGDEVILLRPYYFNHEMTVAMCGCRPVKVNTDGDLQPDLAAIEAAVGSKTRAVVTVSPNNPTGRVCPRDVLQAISSLCARHGLYHISDEAYEDFYYEPEKQFSPASAAQTEPHLLSLFSLSKSYGFASWRIGYMVIPLALREAVVKVQDNVLICPPAVSQFAAKWCLMHGNEYVASKKKAMVENRALFLRRLREELAGIISDPVSEGAFYIFLQLKNQPDDFAVALHLVKNCGVTVIPGSAFGADPGYLRLSFGALQAEHIDEALSRLIKGLKDFSR